MPINAVALAPEVVAAAGSTDAVGILGWTAISGVIATWLLTGIPSPLGSSPLIAVVAVVEGEGSIIYADSGASLGVILAAAAGSVDAAGLAKWAAVGLALGGWMNSNAVIDPANLIASPGVGSQPLSGAGGVAFKASNLGVTLAAAAGSVDAPGILKWTAIGNAITSHMSTFGVVNVGTMQSPGAGGPVTGAGVLA